MLDSCALKFIAVILYVFPNKTMLKIQSCSSKVLVHRKLFSLIFSLFVWSKVSCSPGWPSCLLPPPLSCCDYRHAPTLSSYPLIFACFIWFCVTETTQVLHMLGANSIPSSIPSTLILFKTWDLNLLMGTKNEIIEHIKV